MVIADPIGPSSATAPTTDGAEGLSVGDCQRDTLTGISKNYFLRTNDKCLVYNLKTSPSWNSRFHGSSNHLWLQHWAAHVGADLSSLCDDHDRRGHRGLVHHQAMEHQSDSVRVWGWQPHHAWGELPPVSHCSDRSTESFFRIIKTKSIFLI